MADIAQVELDVSGGGVGPCSGSHDLSLAHVGELNSSLRAMQ